MQLDSVQDSFRGEEASIVPVDVSQSSATTVLLMVKEHTDLLWVSHFLADTSEYKLTWCNSLPMAMDVFRYNRYDLVIWEEHLCEETQEDFLRVLVHYARAPVIVLGSCRDEKSIKRLFMRGASDYLGKHELNRELLLRAIRHSRYRSLCMREQQLRDTADSLTGILDRTLFHDRLHQAFTRARRNNKPLGLIFLNVDKFRGINQSHGYRIGDTVIKMVSSRIRQILRQSDSLARVGGDEFAIILEEIDETFSLSQVANKLKDTFSEPYVLKGKSLELSVSMGMASFPEEGNSAEMLLQHANQAMYDAKKEDGSSFRFFDPRRNEELKYRLELESELRQAIRSDKLDVFYQPKMDLETGEIIGMEALVRWPHPRFGMLSPHSFIPAAERSSLIIPMGYWVLERTCKDLAELQSQGYQGLQCSVNLSFRQFYDQKLTETVFRIIYSANIDTSGFEFELTESAMMYDQDYTVKCLKELTRLGINFSLDDFGTGYSSFSNLRTLPLSTVKIDRSFVERLPDSKSDQTLVAGMISLAHNLNMKVVAEGVETKYQLDFLKRHQCDFIQGYLIAKPMPYSEFCQFIKSPNGLASSTVRQG